MRFNSREVGGETHPTSKLSDIERWCIQQTGKAKPRRTLARIFNVSERTIGDVQNKPPIPCPVTVSG